MKNNSTKPKTPIPKLIAKNKAMVDEYISSFDPAIQTRLSELRQLFFEVLPTTEESIRYKIPAFKVGNHYLYFAGYKNHIGFYPVYGLHEIEDELSKYRAKGTKDSLHFLHCEPLPIELIKKIIELKSEQLGTTNLNNEVNIFLDELKHPLRTEINLLRSIILVSNSGLIENVKWNGPNFCFENQDRITMRIQPPTQIQIIFHRGAKVKEQPKERLLKNDFGILVWKENDRAIATFSNIDEINSNKDNFTKIVTGWIDATK
jgi:uncharacterized protein YdhG (YjbR/CyaY superfamily)